MMQSNLSARALVPFVWVAAATLIQGCQTSSVKQSTPSNNPAKSQPTEKTVYASPHKPKSTDKPKISGDQGNAYNTEIQTKKLPAVVKPAKSASYPPKRNEPASPNRVSAKEIKSSASKMVKSSAVRHKTVTAKNDKKSGALDKPTAQTTDISSTTKSPVAEDPSATLEKPQATPAAAKQTSDSLINGNSGGTVNNKSTSTINNKSTSTQAQQNEVSGGTQLALAEPPKVQGEQGIEAAVAPKIPALKLTVDALPHDFGAWTLEHNWDNQHPDTCRLRSIKTSINDGYESTWLWAEILPDEINIYTGSNIDLSYEGTGLQFGNKPVEKFTGFLTETAATMAGEFSKALADAGTVTVYLGFWPTWPKTEVQQVTLSGQALATALTVFEACQTW